MWHICEQRMSFAAPVLTRSIRSPKPGVCKNTGVELSPSCASLALRCLPDFPTKACAANCWLKGTSPPAPRCCRGFRSCVSQQACYRFRNLLTSGLLVESETRGWIDLETIPPALWRTAQIDAREEQTQFSRKSAASLTQFRFERTCTDFGPTAGAAGVA